MKGSNNANAVLADAITALLAGRDVLLSTGTASGKSLCYQVPMLDRMLEDPKATALLVFPAKALARDQAETWNKGIRSLPGLPDPAVLLAHPYDGDSDAADRRIARDAARLLVTNPEMIHANMLPGHGRWQRFLSGLQFVVLDEVHTYTGFFGANMANVVRRLDRICAHYGSHPSYVCCSATIGNPGEVAELLTGRPFEVIDADSSASGTRTFVFWNPPRIKQRAWRGRRSANVEAHELMARLVAERVPTICFSKARNTAEMIYRYVRERLEPILATTLEHLLTCDCEDGCPNCTSRLITPYHVRNIELGEGQVHSRRAAAAILDAFLNGGSVLDALKRVDAPREHRGQAYLPSIIDHPRLTTPHRLPLNERTRALLLRKLERSRSPKPGIDHAIDIVPPEGAAVESGATLSAADSERRSGHGPIRHAADPLARKLRQRLSAPQPAKPEPGPAAPEPPSAPTRPIQAGDSVARRARLKRHSRDV